MIMGPADQPCPVEALGKNGDLYLLRERAGRLHAITVVKDQVGARRFELAGGVTVELFNREAIEALFAKDPKWPRRMWPRRCARDTRHPIRRFATDQARKALMKACCEAGFYAPMRGWTD